MLLFTIVSTTLHGLFFITFCGACYIARLQPPIYRREFCRLFVYNIALIAITYYQRIALASLLATPRPLFLASETYYTRKHNIPVPFSFIPTHGIPCLLSYRDKYYHLKKDETAIKLSKNNTFIAVDVLRPTKQKVY